MQIVTPLPYWSFFDCLMVKNMLDLSREKLMSDTLMIVAGLLPLEIANSPTLKNQKMLTYMKLEKDETHTN